MALGNRRVDIDIVANDKATGVYSKVSYGMRGMASNFNNSINRIDDSLRRYNSAMNGLYRSTQVALAGTGYLVYKFTKDSIKAFADFEKQHGKTIGAIAANYAKTAEAQKQFLKDQQNLKKESIVLGTVGPTKKGTFYSPTEVSYAQTALAKSGMKQGEISTVLNPILKFAGGNDLGIETAAEYAVQIGNMFDIPKQKWGQMLDQITRAADVSVIDVPDIFETLKYAGGITSAMKRPFEEVLGMVSIMGNAGLKGSMAGTGIQSFFTRLMGAGTTDPSKLKTAPSDKALKAFTTFKDGVTDKSGHFKDMPTITENLDKTMEGLNDKEQAWFAYKLFGLFQMKAGFTLANNGGDKLQSMINDIKTNSPGTNDRKWDIMLGTSYGRQQAFKNAMTGVKTDVGERLSPITNAIIDELFGVLTDHKNYTIDFTKMKTALKTASESMASQYGKSIGEMTQSIGTLMIDGSRIGMANLPLAGGFGTGTMKLLNGDIAGGLDAFKRSIKDTNDNIDKMPPELQDMARQVRNAVVALEILTGVDFAARMLGSITTIWRATLGKMITPRMDVKATSVQVVSTGVLNKDGKPIGKVVPVGGEPVGTTGGKIVPGMILGANGKPISGSANGYTGLVDSNGRPINSQTAVLGAAATKGGMMSKIGKSGVGALWGYGIAEMFGVNDWILDHLGIKQGSGARAGIDKGRGYLNTGLSIAALDKFMLGGALSSNAGKLLANPYGLMALGVGSVGYSMYNLGKAGMEVGRETSAFNKKIDTQEAEYKAKGITPQMRGAALQKKMDEELKAEAAKVLASQGNAVLMPARPRAKNWLDALLHGGDIKKQQKEYDEKMKQISQQNRQNIVNSTKTAAEQTTTMTSAINNSSIVAKMDKMESTLAMAMKTPPKVDVSVQPDIKVNVTVDQSGRVLTQSSNIQTYKGVDTAYKNYLSRVGGSGGGAGGVLVG